MKKIFYLGKEYENKDHRLREKITCINFSIFLLDAAIRRIEEKRLELRQSYSSKHRIGRQ